MTCDTTQIICVAGQLLRILQICFDWLWFQVKLWQSQMLLTVIGGFYNAERPVPIILAGDFNSTPDSAVYQLIKDGQVNTEHPEYFKQLSLISVCDSVLYFSILKSSQLNLCESCDFFISRFCCDCRVKHDPHSLLQNLPLSHNLRLQSSYYSVSGMEASFTNFTQDFVRYRRV